MGGAGLVVRVAAVGVDGDDGEVVGDEVFAGEGFLEKVLDFVLGGAAGADAAADFLEGLGGDGVDGVAGLEVSLDLVVGPSGFELGDEVGGADDVLAQAADHVGGARIDHGNCKYNIVGRVLHGDVAVGGEHLLEAVEELLPSGVLFFGAGQGIEVAGFDLVHQLRRLALGRDEIVPAARDHQAFRKSEHAVGDRVAMMVIVEEPGVDVTLGESVLNGRRDP